MAAFPSRRILILRGLVLCALCVFAPLMPTLVQAQSLPLYTVSPADAQLRTVEPLTGKTLTSISITLAGQTVMGANGLDRHPVTGDLYALLQLQGQAGRELVTLDPATGVATDIGNTGHKFAGMTFRKDSQGAVTLFAIAGSGDSTNPDDLFTLDITTGAATLAQDRTQISTGGETIAFDPVDGQLYHAYGFGTPNTAQIFEKIDPATLAVTNIPLSVDTYFEATALTHWAGNMFLLGDVNNNLFVVTSDGKVRFLSPLDHTAKGLVFAGTPPTTCPPAPGTLFGAAHQGPDGPSVLYQIDASTGAPTLIGPIGFELVGAIAFDATGSLSGSLYGVGQRMDGTNTSVLVTINPCTGAGTEVGPTGIEPTFDRVMDISFRQSDGVLFADLFGSSGQLELATIDRTTGHATSVGEIFSLSGSGNGIAFSANDILFHADDANLSTIDPATGAPTQVAPLSFSAPADNFPRINALDFQPSTGTLYGSVNDGRAGTTENYLGTIDTTTGVVTLVSTTQTQAGLDAIAFAPAVVLAIADLSVTKTGAPNPVIEGDTLTYTLHVSNNGPSGATGVLLTDALPAGVTFVSANPGQGNCSQASGTVTCNLGTLASAGQVTVTIVGRPTGAANLSNTASVTATESDPNTPNNSATATGNSLGFTLSNTSGTVTVNAGQTGQFTIHVAPGAGGFPNAITFAASNLPPQTTASFDKTSVTPGNSAADVVLSLATMAPASLPPPGLPRRGPWPITVPLLTACALMLLWFMTRRGQGQVWRRAAFALLLGMILFATSFLGCSGHTPTGGTPAGSYDVTVTATSGTATHTTTVTLVVR